MVSTFELFCCSTNVMRFVAINLKIYSLYLLTLFFSNKSYDLYSDMQKCAVGLNANAYGYSISHLASIFPSKSIANVSHTSFSHLFPE